jgi:Ca2+:H+ antiporter
MARRLLWASLALAPVTIVVRFATDADKVVLFVLAAAALVPLAWLIGESTEHAAKHTGPGIGGFLNATFGNAPELIIALFAVDDGLFGVVRGSLTGSVVGNLLLVLGVSLLVGPSRYKDGRWRRLDRRSTRTAVRLVLFATLLFLVVAVPSWTGGVSAHTLEVLSIPVAIVLLLVYLVATARELRRHRARHDSGTEVIDAWPMNVTLAVLAVATAATAVVAEILVGSLEVFAEKAHLSDFFVAVVIVAIVGNAAEHGGAIVVARRGRIKLATEISLSSSAQVALLVIPAVTLISWAISPFSLAFQQVEIAVMGGAAILTGVLLWRGHAGSLRGALLVAGYVVAAALFYFAD